jgi:glucosamine--fructose-6-phosphate aminotransferase (isomerizing)
MAGEMTRRGIAAQPTWLRELHVEERLPEGARVIFTGCGTSYHAAQTAGPAIQALELVLGRGTPADILVCISHEGGTETTLAAARGFNGERWLVTGKAASPLGELCERVIVATPGIEESWCHTASYTCAVAALAALCGEQVHWLAAAVEEQLESDPLPVSDHERWLVTGAGRDWPTAQEAVLKLREGAWVAAEAIHLEQLLHGHLAAIDAGVRCFVLEGDVVTSRRAHEAAAAVRELGCDVTVLATSHPVPDIVPFQRLTVDRAAHRGTEPARIRRDDRLWPRAAALHKGQG